MSDSQHTPPTSNPLETEDVFVEPEVEAPPILTPIQRYRYLVERIQRIQTDQRLAFNEMAAGLRTTAEMLDQLADLSTELKSKSSRSHSDVGENQV